MTVANPSCRNNYVANGSATQFAYSFPIFAASDLQVIVLDLNLNVVPMVLNVNYTVDGVGKPAGGNVYIIDGSSNPLALTSGYIVAILRRRPLTQQTSIRNQGAYFAAIHEDAFDNAIMVDQQLQDQINGCVQLPAAIPPSQFNPVLPASIVTPNAYLLTNSTGTGFITSTNLGGSINTYANLKAMAALAPGQLIFAFATDIQSFVAYCGNPALFDGGWEVK